MLIINCKGLALKLNLFKLLLSNLINVNEITDITKKQVLELQRISIFISNDSQQLSLALNELKTKLLPDLIINLNAE